MCSICWEKSNEQCIKLQNNIFNDSLKNYKVNCLCNITIHRTCINKWIKINTTCPICHKELMEYQSSWQYIWSLWIQFLKITICMISNILFSVLVIHIIFILYLIYFLRIYYEIKLIYYNIIKYM